MVVLYVAGIASTIIFFFVFFIFGETPVSKYETVDVDVAYDLIEKSSEELQILDVRTPEEYQSEHIHDAINVNVRDPDFENQISTFKEDMPVLVYCRSGVRSESAASILASKGFKEIYNMQGGIESWKRAGYQVE